MTISTAAGASPATASMNPRVNLDTVISGQRIIIQAILLSVVLSILGAYVSLAVHPFVGFLVSLPATILGVMGLSRLLAGLGTSTATSNILIAIWLAPVVLSLLSFAGVADLDVPGRLATVVGLAILLVTNNRATRTIRAAGLPVGILGARHDSNPISRT